MRIVWLNFSALTTFTGGHEEWIGAGRRFFRLMAQKSEISSSRREGALGRGMTVL